MSAWKTDQAVTEEGGDGSQRVLGLSSFLSNVTLLGLAWTACAGQGGSYLVSCVWGPSGGPENTVLGLGLPSGLGNLLAPTQLHASAGFLKFSPHAGVHDFDRC